MSALKTTADQPALPGRPIAHDQARALLGQVMGLVAVTVGFTALGAYLGRDLSGATGLVLFIGAFACILGLNIAAAKGREQLAIGLLFGLGLLLGLAVAPVVADYANADPSALWQSAGATAAFVAAARRLRLRDAQRPLLVGAHAVLGLARPDRLRHRRDLRLDPQRATSSTPSPDSGSSAPSRSSTSTACAAAPPTPPCRSLPRSSSTSSTSSYSRSACSAAAGATDTDLRSKESAMSDNTETAILAGGCFWGVQELLRRRDGVISTRVGYTGGDEREPDLPQPSRSRRGGRDRLRPRAHLLPGHPRVLLPDPRPDDQGPPGQRLRL